VRGIAAGLLRSRTGWNPDLVDGPNLRRRRFIRLLRERSAGFWTRVDRHHRDPVGLAIGPAFAV